MRGWRPFPSVPCSFVRISSIDVRTVGVSRKTAWLIVLVEDDEGRRGMGEATLDAHEAAVAAYVASTAKGLVAHPIGSIRDVTRGAGLGGAPGGLAHAAAVSGVEQALWDIWARRLDVPLRALFGVDEPWSVPLYANINRTLLDDRSPEAFAAVAGRAVADGFGAIKCAPFDGVYRGELEEPDIRRAVELGLARLRTVREAVGTDVRLMVDCHYRFRPRSFLQIADHLSELDPYWVEAPVAEHRVEEWAFIRERTTLRLAGGEMMTGLANFRRFIDATGVDVVMPDVKYVGGVSGLREIATTAASRGISVAPHNPSGPVATVATAHAVQDLTNFLMLEFAYGECAWRSDLVSGGELISGGELSLSSEPGLGVVLAEDVAADHPFEEVLPLDVRLFE